MVTANPIHPPDTNAGRLTLRSVRLPASRQPAGRAPAPGALGLVQAFVNTFWDLDRKGGERLGSAEALTDWLVERDLVEPGTRLRRVDLQRALDVREGLRALLYVNNAATASGGAIDRLNRALQGPGLFVELDPRGSPDFRAQRADLDGALALIGTIVGVAQIDGSWSRLKSCPGVHCGWAFYDQSRSQTSNWCAMAVCGSRAKARDYRARKRRTGTVR